MMAARVEKKKSREWGKSKYSKQSKKENSKSAGD